MKETTQAQKFPKHDGNWKIMIENLFEDFVAYFLPGLFPLIDFNIQHEFLEQEFQKIVEDLNKKGKVINDKLVKVFLKDGTEQWILIHIEVQSYFDADFTERMFTYFYRIKDKHGKPITALAVYTGEKVPKNYNQFSYEFHGTELTYKFNSYKIIDQKESDLLQYNNPFALCVLVCKKYLASKKDDELRLFFKFELSKLMFERNFSKPKILELLQFISLTLTLPNKLEKIYYADLTQKITSKMDIQELIDKDRLRHADFCYQALKGYSPEEVIKKLKQEQEEKAKIKEEKAKIKEEKAKIKEEKEKSEINTILQLLKTKKHTVKEISEIVNKPIAFIKDLMNK